LRKRKAKGEYKPEGLGVYGEALLRELFPPMDAREDRGEGCSAAPLLPPAPARFFGRAIIGRRAGYEASGSLWRLPLVVEKKVSKWPEAFSSGDRYVQRTNECS
jgi:hypothetical protein